MSYSRYPKKQQPTVLKPDFLVMKWQTVAVLGSRLAMAIVGNAPQEEVDKLAKQYNILYAEAIKS